MFISIFYYYYSVEDLLLISIIFSLEHCGTYSFSLLLLLFSDQTETNFNSLCFGGTEKKEPLKVTRKT